MKAVLQRVKEAAVTVGGETIGACGVGFLILLGVEKGDTERDAERLAAKISRLRVFNDENGKMNLSLSDVGGSMLVVSNFTLCADCRHGNRPDYFGAETPDKAERLYEFFACRAAALSGRPVQTGRFGADMEIRLVNDGPVTITLESAALLRPKDLP